MSLFVFESSRQNYDPWLKTLKEIWIFTLKLIWHLFKNDKEFESGSKFNIIKIEFLAKKIMNFYCT